LQAATWVERGQMGSMRPEGRGAVRKSLSTKKIVTELAWLPGWASEHDGLAKTFEFADFRAALAFMVRAGFEAEELNHHPEWMNVIRPSRCG
jgi:pterin-4a-carbinolamine dehydratase